MCQLGVSSKQVVIEWVSGLVVCSAEYFLTEY
jgi:hypothetical protein